MKTLLALLLCFAVHNVRAAIDPFLVAEVERLERQSLEEFANPEKRAQRLAEVREMFGQFSERERGDLRAHITGRVEDEHVVVEKLHFQSSPGLYVTANLYLPKKFTKPLPTVLYVCGHSLVKSNGVSYGNKAGYGHHAAWFARNGYACLIIDTLQLGEIEGLHHGTHREGMWWWNSRGYSPAAVEAWNCVRALDYLETRAEVDKTRFAVTGRSGGGAYSWSALACDERVKVAAPVAGITDLRNYVIDGAVEGHCDCMFFVNTYGWDYPMLAASAAPRPLLIVNTDADSIFPLDGVVRTHRKVADLYRLLNRTTNLGLVIGPGPHKDTQDLQVPVFRWFNQHLRKETPLIDIPATNHFSPTQLRVLYELPKDQKNTTAHEWFIPKAAPGGKIGAAPEWETQREIWMSGLRQKVFRNWPTEPRGVEAKRDFLKRGAGEGFYKVEDPRPRGGLDARAYTHLRRRYMLVGHTLDSMRVHDIVQGVKALGHGKVTLEAEGDMAVNTLFASLFLENVSELKLKNVPASLMEGPDYLNALRVLDLREALALALEKRSVLLSDSKVETAYARGIAEKLKWPTRLQ